MTENRTLLGWLADTQAGSGDNLIWTGRLTEARGDDDGPVTKAREDDGATSGLITRQRGDDPPETFVRGDDPSTAIRGDD
ncbi:MAG: hypothetical protein DHS20C19_17900 [Acidimicrobiales bacterium]|nr:MAG: hypothetical protein DHS20C19_17900 [Acidimicrobiales bacterium]